MEHSTTGQAGDYLTDSAPESAYQPEQPLGGSYCDLVASCGAEERMDYLPATVFPVRAAENKPR
jgi:hypothetical protein